MIKNKKIKSDLRFQILIPVTSSYTYVVYDVFRSLGYVQKNWLGRITVSKVSKMLYPNKFFEEARSFCERLLTYTWITSTLPPPHYL